MNVLRSAIPAALQLVAVLALVAGLTGQTALANGLAVEPPGLTVAEALTLLQAPDDAQITPASCCKRCSKGKACGDSCIARNKSCSKGVGCACDG